MRSPRSGSETRQRQNDVRIRLDDDEIEKWNAELRREGFHGKQARGDWVRAHLGMLGMPDPSDASAHQRVPVPGGQALLARLGEMGMELKKLTVFTGAYVTDRLSSQDRRRVEADLLPWIATLLRKLDGAIEDVASGFAEEAGRR